jgi:hypothetical protein
MEVLLSKIDEILHWANDVKDYALKKALAGKKWNGFKVVEGRSNRKFSNENAVASTVTAAGYKPFEEKLLGVTAMQKMLGKERFNELLASYIERSQGKATLVPESDKRPAMNSAKADFEEKK